MKPPQDQYLPTAHRVPRAFTQNLLVIVLFVVMLVPGSALGQATPAMVKLTPEGNREVVVIRGDRAFRYFVDRRAHTVMIPDAKLSEGASFPDGIEAHLLNDYIVLGFAGDFRHSLSADEKTLFISVLPATPAAQVGNLTAVPALPNVPVVTDPSAASGVPNPDKDPRPAPEPLVFYLANAQPAQVASTLTKLYPNLRIEVDERQRALFVLLHPQDQALIEKLVKQLDAARPQIMFEAEVLEVNRDFTQSIGLQYDSIFSFKLNEGTPPGNLFKLGDIARTPISLSFNLNLLQTSGAAKILARPRVATLDGLEARINATQTTPLVIPASGNSAGGVQNITTGITLKMLPKVGPNGTIEVQIAISVSTPTGVTAQGAPQFSSRDATTILRVNNGESFVIGGLIERRRIEGVQKVPGLGDIPILGELFTTRRVDERETDLVIVVTPRLITEASNP